MSQQPHPSPPRATPRPRLEPGDVVVAGFGLYTAAYLLWTLFRWGGEERRLLINDLAFIPIGLAAVLMLWRCARHPRLDAQTRRAWALVGLASAFTWLGNLVWAYYELVLGDETFASWADAAYLIYYPLLLWGLLSFPAAPRGGAARRAFWLDTAVVLLAGFMAVWYFLVRPVAIAENATLLEVALALAYPVGDLVLVFGVATVLLRQPRPSSRGALRLLAAAALVQVVYDLIYAYLGLQAPWVSGSWPDALFMGVSLLVIAAAQLQHRQVGRGAEDAPAADGRGARLSLLPYLSVAGAYALLVGALGEHRAEPIGTLVLGAALLTGLVLVRQLGTARQNERLLAGRAALRSERRFRALIENGSDLITLLAPDGTIGYQSPSVERVLGYAPQELVGRAYSEHVHPDDAPALRRALDEALAAPGARLAVEHRFRSRAGDWRMLESYGRNLLEEEGVGGLVLNSRDITERQAAEQALREREERLRLITESIREVFYLADPVTHAPDYVSPAAEAVWGIPAETFHHTPEALLASILPEDQLRLVDLYLDVVEGRSADLEYRIRRPDGEVRWIRDRVTPLRDAEGRVWRLAGAAEDVTEHRRASEALRQREELLAQINATIQEVFYVLEAPGLRLLYVSPAYERIWGRSVESLHGDARGFLEAVLPEDRAALEAAITAKLRGEARDALPVEYRIRRPDGEVRWLRARTTPLHDDTGRVYRVIGAVQDVTEERRLAEELRQAQKLEAIGRLAGGIAHDFNNILLALTGTAHLALDDLPPEHPVREDLRVILQQGERAAVLTRQLLAFGRRQVLQPEVVDVNGIVGAMQPMLQRFIGEHVRVTAPLAPEPATVRADPGQLEQVLMNLALNARDAMPDGGVLTLQTRLVAAAEARAGHDERIPPGDQVVLSVADTGAGMDAETVAHVFEPFFTTKVMGKGTGLGLASVYGIVTQSGGEIWVESEPGRGTRVMLTLPYVRTVGAPRPAPSAGQEPPTGPPTVLLAEDEPTVRALARRILERGGYRVLAAADGEEALARLREYPDEVHLLLTDVLMPGLGGPALAEQALRERPALQVLFMSGHAEEELTSLQRYGGPAGFVAKPFGPDELLRRLRERLGGGRGGTAGDR